ncbi:MAG: 16S rRNA (guanine(527)-N(7))-methyltransferase RsmG [Bdellovibrionaceae bacterium]|nr:16S rRNA (guanine(527)-N(7))-methyltransferase RsmG [Pseudobdellovibrionaceae bacterium]
MKDKNREQRTKKAAAKDNNKDFSLHEIDERIYDVFCNHGFEDFPHNQRQELSRFCELLLKAQKRLNLTRLLKLHEVALKHFIDCLIVDQLWDLKFPLADLGTGPGFPGIPLKVLYPDEKIILVESVQKRVSYLKDIREQMGFKNLDILGRKFDPDYLYPCASFITRALQMPIEEILLYAKPSLPSGGEVVLMKGPAVDNENLEDIASAIHDFRLKKVIPYTLPQSNHHRRLVIYEKI